MPRGQVTIFMLIGIVIILSLTIIIIVGSKNHPEAETADIQPRIMPVKAYITSCIEKSVQEAAAHNSLQGGMFNVTGKSIPSTFTFAKVPIYYDLGTDLTPSAGDLAAELDRHIATTLVSCLDFSPFSGMRITTGDISSSSRFNNQSITTTIDMATKIRLADGSHRIERYQVTTPSSLPKLYRAAAQYVDEQEHDRIATSRLIRLKSQSNITSYIYEQYNKTLIFRFTERNESFYFGMEYDWETVPEDSRIEDIPDLTAKIGYEFSYRVRTHGNVSLKDDSPLFDINPDTGQIRFTPTYEDSGDHIITITGANVDSEVFRLTVENFGENPQIHPIGYLDATSQEPFTYQVQAKSPGGHTLYYQDNTSAFDIDTHTGEIAFTPTASKTIPFTIRVTDEQGHYATETGHLIIRD